MARSPAIRYAAVPNDRYARIAQSWHWGIPATRAVHWEDPLLPARLIEIGQLCELHIVPIPEAGQRKRSKLILEIDPAHWRGNHVAFDPRHPGQRLYLLLDPEVREGLQPGYSAALAMPLAEVARVVGARHGNTANASGRGYPAVSVCPLGVLSDVTYFTHKKGDETSAKEPRCQYIHEMGEEGGVCPAICVDAQGRLWIAGGSYTCPVPGITH